MQGEKETWGEYSKLVLNELQRLNENYEKMSSDIRNRFEEMNNVLTSFKNTERTVEEQKDWIKEVNEVWSPKQMKEVKDEVYKQKNKWVATAAILIFIQIVLGLFFAYLQGKK